VGNGMNAAVRATVVVGGHPFNAESFSAMFEALDGVDAAIVAWPEAERLFTPGGLADTDVVVLYDMPGVGLRSGEPPVPPPPPTAVVDGWHRLLDEGVPVVAMHHSIASWPAWPEFADILGGRFHYAPASLRGVDYPDSGYALDVHQRLTVLAKLHPVTAGLPASFSLTDETYLCPMFGDEVTPLIGTDAPLDDQHHWSAVAAVCGRMFDRDGWSHPAGTQLAAWTHRVRASTVIYVQPGDGPAAFTNTNYRRLLGNAITWAATTRPVAEEATS
jgi:hypothetical protein